MMSGPVGHREKDYTNTAQIPGPDKPLSATAATIVRPPPLIEESELPLFVYILSLCFQTMQTLHFLPPDSVSDATVSFLSQILGVCRRSCFTAAFDLTWIIVLHNNSSWKLLQLPPHCTLNLIITGVSNVNRGLVLGQNRTSSQRKV